MEISLPGARNVFLPSLPPQITDSAVKDYLEKLKSSIEKEFTKAFDNVYTLVATGTSGTFIASNGATVTVVNGIITALT